MTETADRCLGFVTNLRAINFDSLVPATLPQTNFIQSRQKVLIEHGWALLVFQTGRSERCLKRRLAGAAGAADRNRGGRFEDGT
ncbi:hypothetical protein [Bradyrhizobium ivorense]|uniref:hypothetical protein n=1 Tax=Bradyrhizobium ivorense TaxID=2511166 RepID=UPI001E300E70|nr:hypothetical protein [Bradyrhizobium ivorense]